MPSLAADTAVVSNRRCLEGLIQHFPCAALLFDMDGVLVDSRAIVERTWRRWAARHGIDAERILQVAHGRRTSETLQEVVPHLAAPEEIAWLDEAELVDDEGVVAVPGAAELVAMLRRIPWAVVTSAGPELARRRLTAAGLPVPPVLVSSNDVVRGKPAPDGYLLAAERLSVAASNVVVFEDAPAGWPPGELQGAPLSVWPRHTRPHSSRAPTLSWLT